jgi:HK97 family phage portal protein
MGIWDDFLRRSPKVGFEVKVEATQEKRALPKAQPLDTSLESLQKYARRNELVYACIQKKAQAAAEPTLIVERKDADGVFRKVEDHPFIAVWNKPNPYDDAESLMKSWVASENFADVVYLEKVMSRGGDLVELHPLNPASVTPQYVTQADGYALDYYLYDNGLKQIKLYEDDVIVRRRHAQGSIYDGVSNVSIALGAVDADVAMTDYVRAFFNNDGVPSGQLIVKDRRLSNEEAESLQQKWSRKFGRGGANRKGVVVLDQSAEFQKIGSNLNELASDSITGQIESRICMAFGVPPVLVGAFVGLQNVNQKASFEGAMAEFWRGTMSPELKSIKNFLTWNLLSYFESEEDIRAGRVRVNWDYSAVDAMQENLNETHKRVQEDYAAGLLTLNEARAVIGYAPLDGGDEVKEPNTPPSFNSAPETPKHLAPESEIKSEVKAEVGGREIDLNPTEGMREEARLYRKWKEEGRRGGTEVAANRASQILSGDELSADTVITMAAWFARHEVDKEGEGFRPDEPGFPSPGRVAWAAWGGDPGQSWATRKAEAIREAELKKVEFNGLMLSRLPNENEQVVDLKGMVEDQQSIKDKIASALQTLRKDLIAEAAEKGKTISEAELYQLTLTPSREIYRRLERILGQAIADGGKQVVEELAAQGVRQAVVAATDATVLGSIVDLTVSRAVNEMQTRAINQLAIQLVTGTPQDQAADNLSLILSGQSEQWTEDYAGRAANSGIQEGRGETLLENAELIDRYQYSALLDANTCEACAEADGMESDNIEDLPEVPNPDCAGFDRCRCFIVAIAGERN